MKERTEELLRANEDLKARERKYREMAEELHRRNRELDDFTYVVAHDLQEPLRALLTFSRRLEDDAAGDLSDRARRDLDHVTKAAERMQTLVRDLLSLARAGNTTFRREPVNLERIVDAALAVLAARIEESGAVIERDPLPEVLADETLVGQIYANLVANAIKFTAEGEAPRVRLTAREEEGRWVLGVKDRGIGFDPEHAERIFAPFQRLRSEFPGTGIGLAICRRAVQRHDGEIRVESAPGAGAWFEFTLEGAANV